jgi:hypothetical protein
LCYLVRSRRRQEARVSDDTGDDPVRDEDDHDLLTFSESGIRLREEIVLTEAALRACSGAERHDALQARLRALTDALARNTRHADANPGVQGFLSYTPPRPGQAGPLPH